MSLFVSFVLTTVLNYQTQESQMPYHHLSDVEREEIAQLYYSGKSFSEIGRELGRHKSTISREIRRNRVRFGNLNRVVWRYFSGGGRVRYRNRRIAAKQDLPRILDDRMLLDYVKQGLKQRWSPEQISWRIMRDHPRNESMRVSHETIYQWVRDDKKHDGKWYLYLRQSHKKRRKKYGSTLRRYRIQNRIPIEARPQAADQRKRIGDWEGDTMEGKNHQGKLLTLVDRKSRYTMALKLETKHSTDTIKAIERAFKQLPKSSRRTLTLDNGSEFAHFERLQDRKTTKVYFANPYASWERGTNENTNGLIRQYFPKTTDFNQISHQQLAAAIIQLNNRPRKCLNWRTPKEVFLHQ